MDMAVAQSPENFNSQILFFFPIRLSACEIASAALVLLQLGMTGPAGWWSTVCPGVKHQARPIL